MSRDVEVQNMLRFLWFTNGQYPEAAQVQGCYDPLLLSVVSTTIVRIPTVFFTVYRPTTVFVFTLADRETPNRDRRRWLRTCEHAARPNSSLERDHHPGCTEQQLVLRPGPCYGPVYTTFYHNTNRDPLCDLHVPHNHWHFARAIRFAYKVLPVSDTRAILRATPQVSGSHLVSPLF
jgi:hypothetical protein